MGFDFSFRSLADRRELRQLVDFITGQDLGYPGYDSWVQRAESELDEGYKKAILAFSGRNLVGDAVYQEHKNVKGIVELKNLRVHPELRKRYFARFMVEQVVAENQNAEAILCDTRTDKTTLDFLSACKFVPLLCIPLYNKDVPDITMIRFLGREENSLLAGMVKRAVVAGAA